MKSTRIWAMMAVVCAMAVGCDQQKMARNNEDRSQGAAARDAEKEIKDSARSAKKQIEEQADAQKQSVEAEAKAAEAQIEAQKASAKAQATNAQAKVDAETRDIREAAGAASTRIQNQSGSANSTTVTPPSTTPAPSTTPSTTPSSLPTPTAGDADTKLTEQVQTAIGAGATATTDAGKNVQVSAANGTVTLKGTVKTDAEKSQMETAAKAVPGVTKVENQIEVKAE